MATSGHRRGFKSFEFAVVDVASEIADNDAFILAQGSASFRYSGRPRFGRLASGPGVELEQLTSLFMECGIGVDISIYRDRWRGRRQGRVLADGRGQIVLLQENKQMFGGLCM